MQRHLVAVTVGPVQDFIAAARRTRDLWFGSHVLSEISRGAAKAISAEGAKLIFPESSDATNVANVILAEVPQGDPATIARAARKQAGIIWRQEATRVLEDRGIASHVDRARWEAQVDDVVEFYAAWVTLPSDGGYQESRRRVMRLLAGRKACRNFAPSSETEMRIKKSSLDGARETVLLAAEKGDSAKRLRLNAGEQLDVVGLTKRHGGGMQNYPSVARIAADPWLFNLRKDASAHAGRLLERCERLERAGIITPVNWKQFAHFPFEGSVVYVERHKELWEQARDSAGARRQLAELKIREVYGVAGEPSPYLAIISADGDGMGHLISQMKTAEQHRGFSRQLSKFASEARHIVDRHFGKVIYAGGDEVLALVPVDMALECAWELWNAFRNALQGFGGDVDSPTLSVGVGIGHFMEPLEDLLEYAREAEKHAKGKTTDSPGNGLAVHLHTRGGEPSRVRGRWSSGIYDRLQKLTRLYGEDKLADKAGYDLEEVARKYDGLKFLAGDDDWLARALPNEAAFVLRRKSGAASAPEVHELLRCATSGGALHNIARELMIARRLGKSWREGGRRSALPVEERVNA